MLISTWLTAVRNRLQAPRVVKRRQNQKQASQASENLETRALLTTTLQGVRPNVGEFLAPGEIRHIAPQELTLQFSLGSTITPSSINTNSIQVFRSGDPNTAVLNGVPDVFSGGNEVPVTVGYVGMGNSPNEIIIRFGENLRDEHYRIVVNGGTGANDLKATVLSGGVPTADTVVDATFDFQLDLGAQVVAVVPQPVIVNSDGTVTQQKNRIVVYFNDDDLSTTSAQNRFFYQLIHTKDTVSNLDDVVNNPTSVVYNANNNSATLFFANSLDLLPGAGPGTFRLRVGNNEARPDAPAPTAVGADPGDTYGAALSIGQISDAGLRNQILSSAISPQVFQFTMPGANTDPGNREIEVETHLNGGADATSGTTQLDYNFRSDYGSDPSGNALQNVITTAQRERAREVFEFYSNLLGIDFRETDNSGLTIVTGDLRALDPTIPTGVGGVAGLAGGGMAIMDRAEVWDDSAGGNWFSVAMHEIGHLLGLGHAYELPDLTVQGGNGAATRGNIEPDYPGDHDIVHGRYLHRPDSIDIDLYRFTVGAGQTGTFTAEVTAERLQSASRLNSHVRLFRENADGTREVVAQNDDYFSEDSFLQLNLTEGVYYIGVSSTGNEVYDPTILRSGFGGTSQGNYELRLDFRPDITTSITDTTGELFDGDSDGQAGGVYNYWFRTTDSTVATSTLFVNKDAMSTLTSSMATSMSATSVIVGSVTSFTVGDTIRIDNEQMTVTGINATTRTLTVTRAVNGSSLASHAVGAVVRQANADGSALNPFGRISDATAVAQPGQIIRVVGNGGADGNLTTTDDNRPYQIGFDLSGQPLQDGSSLQVPRGVTLMIDGGAIIKLRRSEIGVGSPSSSVNRSGGAFQVIGTPFRNVIFTSWMDETTGTDTTATPTSATSGDWGGLAFRDTVDRAEARFTYQNEGIFLNYVAQADIRWGGGSVGVNATGPAINPIYIDGTQPTIVNNRITKSKDSAMSANPDSFEEMTFHSPRFQSGATPFTSDYNRVGPDIYGNTLLENSTNGLFVRVQTSAGGSAEKLTVSGRFDDTDITHVIAQNLEIQGTPGGPVLDQTPPAVGLITLTAQAGGTLAAGLYNYRIALSDATGFEGPSSLASVGLTTSSTGSIRLQSLPAATGVYTGRKVYRSTAGGTGPYTLVAVLDRSATSYVDDGSDLGRTLTIAATRDRGRLDARLSIDAGTIVKLEASRIETEVGAQFIAEGAPGRPVVFTSRLDDSFGAGGTFDTNNDNLLPTRTFPSPGNWGGIYIGHMGSASIDRALITYAGGIIPVGSNFAGFNAVEVHQAEARIRNTVFQSNGSGVGGTANAYRSGLYPNSAGTIFVRGAQPVILDNDFRNNTGAAININANALDYTLVVDQGRQTGPADLQLSYADNQGPLIRDNRFGGNTLNGMQVRGETLTTQGVWDDTDIVHIVLDEIYIPDFHHYGGLRLESSSTESLVIKLDGDTAGFTADGYPLDIDDRIGGSLQVIGQPGQPVIMTALSDDSVGAGFDLSSLPLRDTNGNGPSTGTRGDWDGIRIQQYAHDRNVKVVVENEQGDRFAQDTNKTVGTAEQVGILAANEKSGDENLRLGFEIHGFIDSIDDADIYSFIGVAGSSVWLDIDRTTHGLNSIVELLDGDGNIVAISNNPNDVTTPQGINAQLMPFDPANGRDLYTLNRYDAGFRAILPGTTGLSQPYYVRVRSSNSSPLTNTDTGETIGVYQLQIRLKELDEFAGNQITYADIRYAETGIEITGQPAHSPLAGEAAENEPLNSTAVTSVTVGNLMNSDRAALYLAGKLSPPNGSSYDVDMWEFTVQYDATQQIAGVAVDGPHVPVTIDLDFADGFSRADVTVAVYDSNNNLILMGRDSNISDDQPRPLNGSDTEDLSRGSNGKLDPFIGPVELIGGETYRLAVFPNDIVPAMMQQFWPNNPGTNLVRFEPINSVRRIAEDRLDSQGLVFQFDASGNIIVDAFGFPILVPGPGDTPSAAQPALTDLFEVNGSTLDPKHIVPFHLGDVELFIGVGQGITGSNRSRVYSVDPFTGSVETLLGQFSQPHGDLAMRADGQLHTFSLGPATGAFSDGNVGNYLRIDTGTAATTNFGDDGISTNLLNGTSAAAHDVGIGFNAMTYTGTNDTNLWAVGNRSQLGLKPGQQGAVAAQYTKNIIYYFNTATGDQINRNNSGDRTDLAVALSGAGTTQVEWGQVDTSFTNGGLNGNITGMVPLPGATGQFLMVDDAGGLYRYVASTDTTTFITNVGGLNISFAGLSFGPDEVEGGDYASTLFGISSTGRLYAFNATGILQPIFNDAATSTQIRTIDPLTGTATNVTTVTGLAFGTLERNLWHVTSNRGGASAADDGHGIDVPPFDNSIALPEHGGQSLYFGNERQGRTSGNKHTDGGNNPVDSGPLRNVDFPGGAHGSIVSNEFSLEGYSAQDKPMMYFNYFLDTENANYDYGPNPDDLMRDAFRVFIEDESGGWNLLVTNNSLQNATQSDEFDYGPDGSLTTAPETQSYVDVNEAFDNSNSWRQARVDLSSYAGRAGLKLRFDFSTAGGMNVGGIQTTGSELYAVPASELRDGDLFNIDGRRFEFDLGSHLTVPSGGDIEGATFTVLGNTFRYTATPTVATDILALPTDSATTIALRTNTFINAFLSGTTLNIPNANALEGESFTILGQTFTYTDTPLVASDILTVLGDSANTMATRTAARINAVLGGGKAFVNGAQVDLPGVTAITFGGSLNTVAGFSLEGESFTFNGQTFTFTANPLLPSDVPISAIMSASTVATNAVNTINAVMGLGTAYVDPAAPTRVSIPDINTGEGIVTGGSLETVDVTSATTLEGESITVFGVTFTYAAIPAQVNDILAEVGDTAAVIAARTRTAINAAIPTANAFIDALAPARVSIADIAAFTDAFVRGGTLVTPTGNNIDGYEFQLNNTNFSYSTNPSTTTQILARNGDSAALIASRTAVVINNVLGTNSSGDPWAVASLNRVSVSELSNPNSGFFLGGILGFVDATAINYEGENFTAYGTTFTFRDPAAAVPLTPSGVVIDAVAGDTAITIATRVAAAINLSVGRTVATQVGSTVEIAGSTSLRRGGTVRFHTTAAAQLDGDTININGFNFTFVSGTAGFGQIQTDANPAVVAGRMVTAVNNLLGAGTAVANGTVVSIRTDSTLIYNDNGTLIPLPDTIVVDAPTGTPMTFALDDDPAGTNFFVDQVDSPLTVDGRSTQLTHDLPDTTLSVAPSAFVSSYVSNNRLTFPSATGITTPLGSPLVVSGRTGVTAGRSQISIFPNMTANEVALAMRQALANYFAATDIDIVKGHENRIDIIGHYVVSVDLSDDSLDADTRALPFAGATYPDFVSVANPGQPDTSLVLPGDSFGAFSAGFVSGQATRPGSLRGMNNAVEGVYIDDIIIGFAERGEMITNATSTAAFVSNRELYSDVDMAGLAYRGIADGAYDVEIRRATDYGESQTPDPTNILYRAIDTNWRETNGISITVPSADVVPHDSTFQLSDGWRTVTFQFVDSYIGLSTLLPGNIPVIFNSLTAMAGTYEDNLEVIANAIVQAINSQAVQDVLAIQASLSDTTGNTSKQIHLIGNAVFTPSAALTALFSQRTFRTFGDTNRDRDQGQIVVQSSLVQDSEFYGINVDAAVAGGLNPTPHPGTVKNTQEENLLRLVTGVVIMNNVIAGNVSGGIRFSGDNNNPRSAVPYGRIVNNTLVGFNNGGIGINVGQSASPTILNNIVADFATGIFVDGSSAASGTTIGATLYRGAVPTNTSGLGDGTFPIYLTATDPLFVDQSTRNYYLAPLSQAIDSSLSSLSDRGSILTVKNPLGLAGLDNAGSPIIAPETDAYGQVRGDDDDVVTPNSQGANVFIDRGAIDRVDFFRPRARLAMPDDQSQIDGDSDIDEVWIDQTQTLRQFIVRLNDEGIGIDHSSVMSSQFVLKRVGTDGVTETILIDGVDYTFAYNSVTNEAIFTAATIFADEDTEVRYILLVDNDGTDTTDTVDGIRDLAGNYLVDNKTDGSTRFDIVLTDGVNDAPEIKRPAARTMLEDKALILVSGVVSVFDQDAHLGTNILTMTLTASMGRLTLGSIPSGLSFGAGDGTTDTTMTFTGRVQDINLALNGMRFVPNKDYFGPAVITIIANDNGEFSGPAAITTETINVTVNAVNDAPAFDILPTPPTIAEDAGLQTINGFMTGQVAGPANEMPPQTVTTRITIQSENSAWTPATFFSTGPSIDPISGNLTYTVAPDVNGTVIVKVELVDSEGLASTVSRTFTITVTPVNDIPVFTRTSDPVSSNEDQTPQPVLIDLINTFAAARGTALDELNTQTLTWSIGTPTTTSGNLVFDSISILADGTLQYVTRMDTAGTATLQVRLRDSGTGANQATFNITITVNEVNDAPVAITGNYVVDEGYNLNLNAGASYDVDAPFGDTLTYAWDLNNDGVFETSSGASPTKSMTWTQLKALGITAPKLHTIKLRVTDSRNPALFTIATATLRTLIVDYGDAPDSYGTLKGSNGAAHTIAGSLLLGATRDKETNGQPGPNSDLDGSDEDGVTFPTSLERAPGMDLPAFVDVVSTGNGKLNIWLDLNRDGVFDHATEHLNGGVAWNVVAGVNRINFTIPAGSIFGDSVMRVRLTAVNHPAVLPTGRASNGEVEDYAVKIRALQAAVTPTISRPIDFDSSDGQIPQTTDSTPTIVWSLHSQNFKYELIVRNAANQIVYSRLRGTNFTPTSDTVTSSLPAGDYTATVIAFNKAGDAANPVTLSFRVVRVAVSSPSGNVNSSRPTIVWNHVPGSKSYTIQIVASPSGVVTFQTTVLTSSMAIPGQFTLPVDLPLSAYNVRIQATDAADLPGDWSAYRNFLVRTAPVLTAPPSVVTTPLPQISWTAVTGAASYEVELYNLTDKVQVGKFSGIQGTSWSPTSALTLAKYRITVRAYNAAGFQGLTSAPRVFTYAPIPNILAPGGRLPDSTPTFGWDAVPSADFYQLVVRQDFGSFLEVYRQNSLTGTIHTLPFSLPIGRYTFSVVAINTAAAGSGQPNALSSSSRLTKFAVVEPPTVTGPAASTFLTRPVVTWTNPPQTDASATSDVRLYRREGTNNVLVKYFKLISGTSFEIPMDLQLGSYVVQVRTTSAVDPATVSDWSVAKTFRVTVAPTLIGPNGRVSDATPTLNWSGVLGGQTYQIEVKSLSKNVVTFAQSGLNALNYTVPGNLPIGRYQFRVQARSAFGELSDWSIPMEFQIVAAPTVTGPASSTFNTKPTFSWTNMAGAVGGGATITPVYDFRLDFVLPNGTVQANYRSASGLNGTSYTIPTALPAGLYRAMVLARTADTTGDNSTFLEFYVGGNPVVNAIGSTTDTTPTISWKAVDGASGYQIFIALDSNPTVAVVQQSGIGSLSYKPGFALAKGKYRVWVRAVNASNGQLSGPALTDAPSIIFTITDASEAQSQNRPGHYTMTVFPENMVDVVSETTISMLPSFVSGSQQPVLVVSEQAVDGDVQLKASAPVATETPVEVAPENVPQTDEILAQWDQQKWWDTVPAAVGASDVAVPEAQPVTSASSGILGALLALAPRSLRRRKKDESAK